MTITRAEILLLLKQLETKARARDLAAEALSQAETEEEEAEAVLVAAKHLTAARKGTLEIANREYYEAQDRIFIRTGATVAPGK